jgi:Phage terminase large subunit (GpA)
MPTSQTDELRLLHDLLNSAQTPEELQQVEDWANELFGTEPTDDDYEPTEDDLAAGVAHGEDMLARQNARTALTQEIGPLPAIKDPARRARCKYDLRATCVTYFPESVYMGFAPYQEAMIDRFESIILEGGKGGAAVRRGGLKSTLARIATVWAVVNGHRKFPVLVGATDDKSNEHRDNVFSLIMSSPRLIEDFPELVPLILKRRNPKKQLRLDGKLVEVMAKDERGCILFPKIDGADCSEARIAPYSLMASDVSGLNFVDSTGRTIRPDLLIFDDVQTPQSAKSFVQTNERENAITTTFIGLAGLAATIAAVMVCTARQHDDLTMRFSDRNRHPDWDVKRYGVLESVPNNKELWSIYEAKLREGDSPEDGFARATAFYLEHREAMDEGGRVAWERDKEAKYVSALQWAMTIRAIQPEYFACELQQEGVRPEGTAAQLVAEQLAKRLSGVPRGIVPSAASYLTAFIDSGDHVLWWAVVAWQKDLTGWVVDYGTWPDQGRAMFYKQDLFKTIEHSFPGISWEEAFVRAHNALEAQLVKPWPMENGATRQIDLILKDWSDGDHTKLIRGQVGASPHRSILRPSKGFAPRPGKKSVHLWGDPKKTRHTFNHWVEHRDEQPYHVQFDSNRWKRQLVNRLQTAPGAPSALLLPGTREQDLALLTEHLTAETQKTIIYDGNPGTTFEPIPGRDNDWFDCIVGNTVAASMLGAALPGEETQTNATQRRVFQLPPNARGTR